MTPRTTRAAPPRTPRRVPSAAAGGAPTAADSPRVIVAWCPDWPVTAAAGDVRTGEAVAVVSGNLVHACSAAARAEGVARGMRVREAQSRCPQLIVVEHEPDRDARMFEPLVEALEELTPGVQVLRPGLVAVRVRGAARYYGGEQPAALVIVQRLDELGAAGARAGIADGIFAAEQAARLGRETVSVVPVDGTPAFLAPLPVSLIDDARLVTLLGRLGIHTLGRFAELPAADVETRFGPQGAWMHRVAGGRDAMAHIARTPPPELDLRVDFEPALDRVDQVAFGVRAAADAFIDALASRRMVCTAIRVELHSDGALSEREWLHPRSFTPSDVVDRVRWQLQGAAQQGAELKAGVTRVVVSPVAVDAVTHHEAGLWGSGADERVHHGLSRVQSLLGHGGVLVPALGGGRTLADRQLTVAWGDRPVAERPADRPWPGGLPKPLPGTVFAARHPVRVLDAAGDELAVDARGALSAPPHTLASGATVRRLDAWAGPWPIDERWWSAEARRMHRLQAVDDTGCAWLLVLDGEGWWAEARYD